MTPHEEDELKRVLAELYKAGQAVGGGADDARWIPGESAVDALIRERDALRRELEANKEAVDLRAAREHLDEAVAVWKHKALLLPPDEYGSVLRQLRAEFGPTIQSGWAMGPFFGPCAHGRDPYTRCDLCEPLSPRKAFEEAYGTRIAREQRTACMSVVFGLMGGSSDGARYRILREALDALEKVPLVVDPKLPPEDLA